MVVLESPTPDVASAAVGLLDPSGPQIPLSVDTSTATGSAVILEDSPTGRGSSSMKMVPKRYSNLHSWLSLAPVSGKQLKEAMVNTFFFCEFIFGGEEYRWRGTRGPEYRTNLWLESRARVVGTLLIVPSRDGTK